MATRFSIWQRHCQPVAGGVAVAALEASTTLHAPEARPRGAGTRLRNRGHRIKSTEDRSAADPLNVSASPPTPCEVCGWPRPIDIFESIESRIPNLTPKCTAASCWGESPDNLLLRQGWRGEEMIALREPRHKIIETAPGGLGRTA